MEILNNNYNNLITGYNTPSGDLLATNTGTAPVEEKKDVGGFLDKLFGGLGRANEIYSAIKHTGTGDNQVMPYDLDVNVGNRPVYQEKKVMGMPATTGYIVIGAGVLILAVVIYSQVKK